LLDELVNALATLASQAGWQSVELRETAASIAAWPSLSGATRARLASAIACAKLAPKEAPHCCSNQKHLDVAPVAVPGLRFEDQDGKKFGFDDFFLGAPSAVAFFYTRCENPEKCSLSIAQLGQLQRWLEERGLSDVRLAAMSYDPAFDNAQRLARYGVERGLRANHHVKLLRALDGHAALRSAFSLGASFGQVTVNQHPIELVVMDRRANPVAEFRGKRWSVEEVGQRLSALSKSDDSLGGNNGAA
jgi:cytochrome oxidase Cu insertion factor (SCO1/SenC/PrrC family)